MITLTKHITAALYQNMPESRVFLELVDECMWCWFMEAYDMINLLSYENMDLDTLSKFFDSLGISVPIVEGKDLNKNAILHYKRIFHDRGMRPVITNLVNSGGFIYPENTIDAKLYHWYDVPKNLISDPKDGNIYVVMEGSVPIRDKDLLDSMMPAGYRLIAYRQVPIIEIKAIGDVQFNKSLSRVIYICAPVQASFAHLYSGKVLADYHRPQFNETWSFTEMFKSGYSIHRLDKKHIQHFFFHFETEEKQNQIKALDVAEKQKKVSKKDKPPDDKNKLEDASTETIFNNNQNLITAHENEKLESHEANHADFDENKQINAEQSQDVPAAQIPLPL